jgi:hypothetical protein
MVEQTTSNDADSQCCALGTISMRKLCILVCGTHRCGTSAVTRVINLLGADIARDLIPATSDNARGYWESAAAIGIHDDLLNSIGLPPTDPFDPFSLPTAWQDTEQAQRAKCRLMSHVKTEFARSSLFVVKDPRISRLVPLWIDVLQALNICVIIIIPFRNPLEVAASLAQRDAVSLPKALLLYFQSYLETELASRGLPRVFVSYDTLLRDWRSFQSHLHELSSLRFSPPSPTVKAEIDRFLTTDLHHHRVGREELVRHPDVPAVLVELFDVMCKAADIRDDLPGRVSFDHLRATCEQVGGLYRRFVLAERQALQTSFTAERQALEQAFERSTSWRMTAPLRWAKLTATSCFRDPLAVVRKLTERRADNWLLRPVTEIFRLAAAGLSSLVQHRHALLERRHSLYSKG